MPTASIASDLQLDGENWRAVPGYEGLYEVSQLGRVRSCDRKVRFISKWGTPASYHKSGKVLQAKPMNGGYLCVILTVDGVGITRAVAHLVYEAFVGPRPKGMHVCHSDGCRTNNALTNLRIDTVRGNHADKHRHGTLQHGSRCYNARANEDLVRTIRSAGKCGSWTELARRYGLSKSILRDVIAGKTWRHV